MIAKRWRVGVAAAFLAALSGCSSTGAANGPGGTSGSGGGAETGLGSGTGGGAGSATGYPEAEVPRNCRSPEIDLVAPVVTAEVTMGGAAAPDAQELDGTLWLRGASGDFALLGYLDLGRQFSPRILAGTYDIYYTTSTSPGRWPINTRAKLLSGLVVGDAPVALSLDIPTTTVSTTLTFNGAPLPMRPSNFGKVELRTADGDKATIASTRPDDAASVLVVPGTYDAYYTTEAGTDVLPLPGNHSAKLRSGIVIGASPVALAFDIGATLVSVNLTLAGAALGGDEQRANPLRLKNDAGDEIWLNASEVAPTFSVAVIPGSYDLYYRHTKVRSGIVVGSAPVSLDVDVAGATVSGKVLLNGKPFGPVPSSLFVRPREGEPIELMVDAAGSYSKALPEGTYDFVYRGSNHDLLANYGAILEPPLVVARSPASVDLDIRTVSVSGRVTVNGEQLVPRTLDETQWSYVGLSSAQGGDVRLAHVHEGSYQTQVIPGIYDLWYMSRRPAGDAPVSPRVRLARGIVVGDSPVSLDIDVPARWVSGKVTVNGAPVRDPDTEGFGALFFVDPDQGQQLAGTTPLAPDAQSFSTDPGVLASGAFSQLVVPGSYDLVYQAYQPGSGVPVNLRASIGCVDLH